MSVADVSQGQQALTTLKLPTLPFSRVIFTSESNLIAAGYDCEPKLFQVCWLGKREVVVLSLLFFRLVPEMSSSSRAWILKARALLLALPAI